MFGRVRLAIRSYLDDTSYKCKLVTRAVTVESRSFKIYSANPFKFNPLEPLLTSIIHNVRSGDVVYDVGANKGLFSIAIARHHPSASIFAFEPDPRTFLKLKANLQLNKKLSGNVKSLQIALGDTKIMRDLFLSSEDARTSLYEYGATWGNAQIKKKVRVEINTIDSLVTEERLPPPQHVKVDAEGAEDIVIEGGLATFSKHLPLIYIETHGARRHFESDVCSFQENLESLGYRTVNEKGNCFCHPPNK